MEYDFDLLEFDDDISNIEIAFRRIANYIETNFSTANETIKDIFFLFSPLSIKGINHNLKQKKVYCDININGEEKKVIFIAKNGENIYYCAKNSTHMLWDLPDFFGHANITIKLYTKRLLRKKLLYEKSFKLYELFNIQKSFEKTDREKNVKNDFFHKILCYFRTNLSQMPQNTSMQNSKYSIFNSLFNEKSDQMFSHKKGAIEFQFQFRIIPFNRCIKLCLSRANGSLASLIMDTSKESTSYDYSEFHDIVVNCSEKLIIEVMKQLALRKLLNKALLLKSSNNLAPLDLCLILGRERVVYNILSRAGKICFHNLVSRKSMQLHYAVKGKSSLCVDYIIRFLRKFGDEAYSVSNSSHLLPETPSISIAIDWRDEDDYTPLALACKLNAPVEMIKLLLSANADISYHNSYSGQTPLMISCTNKSFEAVKCLLSVEKSQSEINDMLQITQDSALYRHLRLNHESLKILKFRKKNGGYFNPLSIYKCNPVAKEPVSGKQAIHFAAEADSLDILQLLIKIGVPTFSQDFSGNTIYHILASRNEPQSISGLLEIEKESYKVLPFSGDVNNNPKTVLMKNFNGSSPLDIGLLHSNFKFVRTLVNFILEVYSDLDSQTRKYVLDMSISVQIKQESLYSINETNSLGEQLKETSLFTRELQLSYLNNNSLAEYDNIEEKKVVDEKTIDLELMSENDEADNQEYLMALAPIELKKLRYYE